MRKQNITNNAKTTKQVTISSFQKVSETIKSSYEEACQEADRIFSPYGNKAADGSRSNEKAKVRIRRIKEKSDGSERFRVVLYNNISIPRGSKEESREVEAEPQESKPKPRHKNDKKGRRRKKRPPTN